MTALQHTFQRTLASASETSGLFVMAMGYLDAHVDVVGDRMKSANCHRAALNETVPRASAGPPLGFHLPVFLNEGSGINIICNGPMDASL